ALRRAIRVAGLTRPELAERLQVDQKTVERWISTGRLPHPRHRAAVASTLGVEESALWSPPATRARGGSDVDLEAERRQYEQALRRIAEHSSVRTRVMNRTVAYEIGTRPEDDRTTDTC